ncbi:MAG: hypothetical protein ACRDI2_03275 [Chloroflexota bacterium]
MANPALPVQQEALNQVHAGTQQDPVAPSGRGVMRRTLLIALMFLMGAAAGVGAAYVVWHPYGEGSLTRAILRKCGTRAAPRGEDRCSRLVEDALDTWFTRYYDGDL